MLSLIVSFHPLQMTPAQRAVYERQQAQNVAEQHKTNTRLGGLEGSVQELGSNVKEIKDMLMQEKRGRMAALAAQLTQEVAPHLQMVFEDHERACRAGGSGAVPPAPTGARLSLPPPTPLPPTQAPALPPASQLPDQPPAPMGSEAPESEHIAVEQFLNGLKSKSLLKDVRALWTVWSTGQFPTSIGAGIKLPGGRTWRDLDAAFYAKKKDPADVRYRQWAGKVCGKNGPGVFFMGRSNRRQFLRSLEQAINDPNGPGESSVLERVQAEVDTHFNGDILSYAAARFVGADRAGPSRQQ